MQGHTRPHERRAATARWELSGAGCRRRRPRHRGPAKQDAERRALSVRRLHAGYGLRHRHRRGPVHLQQRGRHSIRTWALLVRAHVALSRAASR